MVKGNAEVFADIIPKIRAAAPHAILVNATNPVDVIDPSDRPFWQGPDEGAGD
ncbi:MAG: hypothetical protein IPP67_07255 [Rhodospirillaceae bacterium]|nr:hypothetical protein [Rhodospirillaceae bacterium]